MSEGYNYYTMKIPGDLRELFDKYIKKYKTLGYRNVSQYLLHIIQEEAKRILKEDPDLGPD